MSGTGEPAVRVACVSVSAALGGSERQLLEFAERAPRHGVDPLVLAPKEGPLTDALRSAGCTVRVAPAPAEFLELSQRATLTPRGVATLLRGARSWARAIESQLQEPAAVIGRPAPPSGPATHGAAPGSPLPLLYSNGFKAHLACALIKGRRVWHLHEFPPERVGAVWRVLAASVPHATIANSRSVADAWSLPLGVRPVVALNGVDLERFRPAERTWWIHDMFELPREVRLVGMPAVFARWKGHMQVVEAFERIANQVPDAHLVLAGGPIYDTVAERGYGEELVRRVRRSSAGGARRSSGAGDTQGVVGSDRIHFVKFQSEPWRLYPEFDLVVHYSTRPEPFGRVVAEAMACGVPVIATREGGPAEIVEDGATGWLVPPRDTAALARQLVHALAADTATMRRAAREAAERRLSADRWAGEVAAVLVAQGHGA
jgi:glycosyltransferase involved in cell wall biosynthesis